MLKRNAVAILLLVWYALSPFSVVVAATFSSYQAPDGTTYYYDAGGNAVTDPAQIQAYKVQAVQALQAGTGKELSQPQIETLLQNGDLVFHAPDSKTLQMLEGQPGGNTPIPTTLKGALAITPTGTISARASGIDPSSDLGRLAGAVQSLGIQPSDINTNPNTKNLPPDVRQAVAQGLQNAKAFYAAEAAAPLASGGGFFDGLVSFAGEVLSSPIGRLAITVALTAAIGPGVEAVTELGGAGAEVTASSASGWVSLYGAGPTVGSFTAAIAVNEVTQEVVLCATGITCGNGTNGGSSAVSNTQGGTSDLCPNIPGVQTSIPPGYALDSAGNCVPAGTASGPTWSAWSACSGACGGGSGTQTRSCSSGNATDCTGPASQSCTNTTACTGTPTWSAWSACSGACGGGTGTQSRSCSTGNSADCAGPDTQVCANTLACPSAPSTPGSSAQTTTITPPQSQVCIAQDLCAGSTIVHRSSACTDSVVQSCDYGCLSGSCKAPPSIAFSSFPATNPASGSFSATGHLQVRPTLVHSGDSVWLYWSVSNAQSCTVTGTNGDSWSTTSSGPAGTQTSGIVGQTIYTLNCTALSGATPPSIRESQTVNITPYFQER